MFQITQFLGPIDSFLDRIFASLEADGIDVASYELDHVCYRVETDERYEQLKSELSTVGEILSEVMIAGRMIATIHLHDPIVSRGRAISCLELPAPKPGSPYSEGFEHAEFAVGDLDAFIRNYPGVAFDLSTLHKPVNRDVSRKYDGVSVKFHEYPLEYVVKYLQG